MFSQVRQALDSLAAALDAVHAAPAEELREALVLAKPLRARVETLETAVAARIAACERHGDGGAGVLHQIAAVPRSDAARNVRAAAELEQVPAARAALAGGEMCMANAARLARAARSTSPEAVQADPELMEQAKTLPPDEFAHASARWTTKHHNAADLAERHRCNRRNRNVRFWNGEDGTVQMRGAFDAEMGARIQTRIRDEAERLRQADRRLQRALQSADPHTTDNADHAPDATAPHNSVRGDTADSDATVRTRDQRMADALDTILARTAPARTAPAHDAAVSGTTRDDETRSTASAETICSGSATGCSRPGCADTDSGDLVAADPTAAGAAANGTARCDETTPTAGCGHMSHESTGTRCSCAASDSTEPGHPDSAAHTRPSTQVIVRADLADLLDGSGIGEIAGTGPVPGDMVDRLCCNAEVSIVLFDTELNPVYEAVLSRAPTAAPSSPATAAASAAERRPANAKRITSSRGNAAAPPASTTSSWSAGPATTRSTTTTGKSSNARPVTASDPPTPPQRPTPPDPANPPAPASPPAPENAADPPNPPDLAHQPCSPSNTPKHPTLAGAVGSAVAAA